MTLMSLAQSVEILKVCQIQNLGITLRYDFIIQPCWVIK